MRGTFEPCITVPAVTEVCLPQPAHSQVKAFVASSHPLSRSQAGRSLFYTVKVRLSPHLACPERKG
jgi:hypothetical protein